MKSIIYARVSSKEQEQEGYSIPAQLKLLNDYALKNSYKVVKEFVDVETAKRAGRENFNLMIEYLKKNTEIKAILCEKTDRLSRNFRDIAILDDLVNQQSLSIILVKENTTISRDSKSHEKFIFGIKALMAKNYIDNLSEETRKGMLEKAEQGIFPSAAPLGYKNCETKKDGRVFKYLEIDEQRAPVLQKLFRMYSTGDCSLALLAKQAYEEGLRNKGGGKVGKAAIHKILHNPIYYGAFRWYGKLYQGSHPAIISKELFNAVQEAFEAQNRPKQTKRHFAYTGLMVCGKCGCAITAEIKKGKYIYYHCTGFKGKCGNSWVPEKALEEKFADIVKRIHIDEDVLELVKNALLSSHKEELEFHKKRIEILTAQKTKLENRLHQIYIDKIDAKVSEAFFDEMTDKWQEELSQIKEQIGRHENSDSNYLSQGVHILELCNKAHRLYLQQTPLKRAKLLHYILSNCSLDNVTLCPTYRKPFDIIAKGLSRSNWLPRRYSHRVGGQVLNDLEKSQSLDWIPRRYSDRADGQGSNVLNDLEKSQSLDWIPRRYSHRVGGQVLNDLEKSQSLDWIPGRYSDSGLLWHFTALVTEQGKWNHRIISIVREGQTPDQARRIRPKPPKTYRNPIFRAKEYVRMIESGQAKSESDLARKVGISRVRIWQYTSLLDLNPSLVKAVEALGDPMPKRLITERQLRQMLKSPKEQENFITQLGNPSNY